MQSLRFRIFKKWLQEVPTAYQVMEDLPQTAGHGLEEGRGDEGSVCGLTTEQDYTDEREHGEILPVLKGVCLPSSVLTFSDFHFHTTASSPTSDENLPHPETSVTNGCIGH